MPKFTLPTADRRPRGTILLLLLAVGVPMAHASSVTVQSSRTFLEPSGSRPNDKDGCPPVNSSADPEEFTMQAKLTVTSPVVNPTVSLADDNNPGGVERRLRDDLTLDEFSATNGAPVTTGSRDVDYLDGVIDGILAVGIYYTYFNLDKTLYNQETLANCAGSSVTGDRDGYTVALKAGATSVASGTITTIGEPSTSVDQNDLDWLDTKPALNLAEIGDVVCIRTKYQQSSANSIGYLMAHIYHHADRVQLDSVDLYYYDSNVDPGSIDTGVPAGYATAFMDTVYFTPTTMPATQSSGDHWVAEYCFTVVGEGSSRFIPYFITQQSGTTGTWKTDSGYEGWISEPPPINPPVLEVYKTCDASVTSLAVGATTTVTETLEVCNTGLGDAVDVVLVDSLPVDSRVVYASSTGGGVHDPASATVEWLVGSLAFDNCVSYDMTLEITPDPDDVTIATNAGATVTGGMAVDPTQTTSGTTSETCPIDVDPYLPGLAVDKAVSGYGDTDANGVLSPGDDVFYTITYTNTGNQALTGVTVSDDPDESLVASVSAISGGGVWNGDTVEWNIGSLAVGASGSLTYTVTLASGVYAHGSTTVPNVATADSAQTSPVTDSASVVVAAATALALDKAATSYTDADGNGALSPGDTVHYALTYTNTGNAPATGVSLSDNPDETYVSAISAISGGGAYNGATIEWTLGTVSAGATGTVTYSAVLGGAGTFGHGSTTVVNTASLSSAEVAPVTDSASVVVAAAAAITVSKTATGWGDTDGDGVLSPGDTVYYEVAWANTGNATATGATVSDDPDETAVASVDAISDLGAYDGDTIQWDLGDVTAGESGLLTYATTLASAGAFSDGATSVANVVVFDTNETDPATDTETVTVTASAALAIAKSSTGYTDVDASGTLSPGDIVNYSVSVTNTGNAPATGVTLSDDPDESAVSGIDAAASGGSYDGDVVTWSLGTLAPGVTSSVTYSATLASAGVFAHGDSNVVNVATADSAETDPVSDTETVTVSAAAELSVLKSVTTWNDVDLNGVLSPGDTVEYTVDFENVGDATANNVTLVDDPDDAYIAYVETTDGDWDGDLVTWLLGSLAPGEAGTVSYVVTLGGAGTFADGDTTVPNTVTLSSDEAGLVQDSASVVVTAEAALSVSKVSSGYADTDGNGVLSPGDTVHYVVSYASVGNAEATGVSLQDTPNLSYVSNVLATSDGGTWDGASVSWTLGNLAAGTSGSVSYDVLLSGAGAFAHGSTAVTNVVVASSPDTTPVEDDETVSVDAAAALVLAKAFTGYTDNDADGALSPGDTMAYALTWSNAGNAAANNVTLVDDPDEAFIIGVSAISDLGVYDGDLITWNIGTVAAGAGGVYTYETTLADAGVFTDGTTSIYNSVTIDSDETTPVTDDEETFVTADAALAIAKNVTGTTDVDGDGLLSPGDIVSYELVVSNTGNADATAVVASDDPDEAYVSSVDASASGGIYDGDVLSWSLGTIGVGDAVTVSYDVTLGAAGAFLHGSTVVPNTASASSAEAGPVTDSASVTVSAAAELTLDATIAGYTDIDGDGVLSPGDEVTWQLDYANVGNAAATSVGLVDLAEAPWVASVGAVRGGGSASGLTITWDLGTLDAGETGSVTWVGVLADPGVFPHGATVVTDAGTLTSTELAPVSDAAATTVTATAALSVSKATTGYTDADANGVLSPGDVVHYAVTYANTGNAAANGVMVTDDPAESALSAVSNITGGGAYDGSVIEWSLGTVGVAGTGTLTYDVTLASAGAFVHGDTAVRNVVVVDSDETTPVEDDEVVTTSAAAELTIAKSSTWSDEDSNGVLSPGDVVYYQIDYGNVGNAPATGVVLSDDPDETWAIVDETSISGGGSYDNDLMLWNIGDLAAGASGTVTYTVPWLGPEASRTAPPRSTTSR